MIIEALMQVVYRLFAILTSPINIPSLPDGVKTVMSDVLGYLETGIALLANYTDLEYLLVLFGLIIAVDVGILLYKLVMWILRKIPMLGMS